MMMLTESQIASGARIKWDEIKSGKVVVCHDQQLDWLLENLPEAERDLFQLVKSEPNPNRCGIYDQYIAWIDPCDLYCDDRR